MAVEIDVPDGVTDWVNYLETTWVNNYEYRGHGFFNEQTPHTQWAAGNLTESGVILNGSFIYQPPGGFSGTLSSLEFGGGLTGSAAAGYDLDTVLTLDLSAATATTAFTLAIHHLSTKGDLSYLWAYLGEQGTEQNGNASNNNLTSFSGTDILTGAGDTDYDTFVFNSAYSSESTGWGDDTITDFVDGNDLIQFSGYWSNYAEFDAATTIDNDAEGNAVISYTDANNVTSTITLAGIAASQLDASDFYFA